MNTFFTSYLFFSVFAFIFAFAKLNGTSLLSLLFAGHAKVILKDIHDLQFVFAVYRLEVINNGNGG